MKIGFVSDSHGDVKNLSKAFAFLRQCGAEELVHLGDDYTDSEECGEDRVIRVPGIYCVAYHIPEIPNRLIIERAGWRILLSHTRESHPLDGIDDAKPEELIQHHAVDIVLYGHTHVPDITREQGIIFGNPGHLKDDDKRGHPPTGGLLTLTEDRVVIEIYDLKTMSMYKKQTFRKED